MLLSPQLLCLLGLMALGTVHASPSAELKLERGSCPMFWFSYNGRCFKHITTRLSWNNAEKNCQDQGGHLASIHSPEEDIFVLALIQNNNPSGIWTWIGLNDYNVEGRWMWSNCSSDVSYIHWRSGEPNQGTGANCVVTYCYNAWCDEPCSIGYQSVCERYPQE